MCAIVRLHVWKSQNYLCHAWLSDERVVVGTDTGDLLVCGFRHVAADMSHTAGAVCS